MAQSTEDYLDSLLRQAMGIEEPEPEIEPEIEPEFEPEPEPEFAQESELDSESVEEVSNDLFLDTPGISDNLEDSLDQEINIDFPDMSSDVVDSEIEGTNFTSEKASQFFAGDEAFSEDFVYPESSSLSEEIDIPDEMKLTEEGQKILDESFGLENLSQEESLVVDAVEESVIEDTFEEPAVEEAAPSISIDDLDPADANKAMDPDMIAALFASANSDSAPVSEDTAEESVIEDTFEEPAVEEAAPSISIDDLDPADANKAMDPDMIAALFASANGESEEANGDSAGDLISEGATEGVFEEPVSEEAAPSISIDDLDPADANKAMDPDMIAALFASANGDAESVKDDAVADSFDDGLFADEEISDLLNSLDGIGEDSSVNDESETGDDSGSLDMGGLDFGDVDLGSMLDDVNASVDSDTNTVSAGDDFSDFNADDLNALLNSLDGDDDISDIGDMLSKDENSELLDSDLLNSDQSSVEDIFASDSSDVLFDIDSVIDEENKDKKKEKKKKEKKGFFRKKKSDDENKEIIPDDFEGEIAIDPASWDIPEKSESSEKSEKKKGFFARLFEKLFEEVEDEEAEGFKLIEESAVDIAIEGAEVNDQLLKEASTDKKKKKDKKKDKKKEKKSESSEDGDEDSEENPKKKKKKEKKVKKDDIIEEPLKKLPLTKVILIFVLCLSICGIIIFASTFIPYTQDMNNAKKYYAAGDYEKTYEYLRGHELSEKNAELYNKSFTLVKIQRYYDSYLNYMKMGFKIEALNSLVQGVQVMDEYAERAYELGVGDKFMSICVSITNALEETFGVSVDQARQWYMLEGTEDYTRQLYQHLYNQQVRDADGNLVFVPEVNNNEVLNAEENDL